MLKFRTFYFKFIIFEHFLSNFKQKFWTLCLNIFVSVALLKHSERTPNTHVLDLSTVKVSQMRRWKNEKTSIKPLRSCTLASRTYVSQASSLQKGN